ncbi:MAG: glycoside hydrolase family 2 protein [Lachnospiraceae bacterium]|nr:glycoside hydrolase family 2 protein [Lachnospiraceae bacterium]
MMIQKLNTNWRIRQSGTEEWLPAQVPGGVYEDFLAAGKMEDPFWKDNENYALEMMEHDYEYSSLFDVEPELLQCDKVMLHFYGLDTIADITLNGHLLGHVENMHREWDFDVKEILKEKENKLEIHFYSPNKWIAEAYAERPTRGTEDAMDGFVHLRKAHCNFGWDWGPHMPNAGIWREVELRGIIGARIDSVYIEQQHEENAVILKLHPEILFVNAFINQKEDFTYSVTVKKPDSSEVSADCSPDTVRIENPQLWWPNNLGEQPLYTITVALKYRGMQIDSWTRRIGLRTMTVKREKDQWGETFAFTCNGVSFFSMGADYIPEDQLHGRVTPEVTRKLLEKAKFANFNSIRVWGGGHYPDDWFYDLCDEMGLVVWQDFMFACGHYDLTEEFEENVTAEFIDNIKRLRHHASLGLWCGNNEMEQFVKEGNWMTKESELRDYLFLYERVIPKTLEKVDPNTFYWPASPSSGGCLDAPNDENRGDVHYWDVWHGNVPFSEYRKFYFRYISEFGFQSFPSVKTVETFTDDPADMNIFSYIMEKHQRNNSANGKIMNYMQQTFKYPGDFQTVIYASQLLQAEAIRYGVEHFRRNRNNLRCMGAVYWQFNDCWPVASWSSVDYSGRLKALHYYARRFFSPVMISCQEEGWLTSTQKLNWLPFGFEKSICLCVSNETMEAVEGTVRWQIRNADAVILREEEEKITIPALTSKWMEKVDLPDVDLFNEYVSYQFIREGCCVSEGTVIFSYPKYFNYQDPKLSVRCEGDEIVVTASAYAKSVEISNEMDDLYLSDNFFDMNAGEKRVKILAGETKGLKVRSVYDIQ